MAIKMEIKREFKVLLWEMFGGPGLTWSDLWKNKPLRQKRKW